MAVSAWGEGPKKILGDRVGGQRLLGHLTWASPGMWPFKKKDDDHHGSAAAAHAHMQKIGKWHIDEKVLGEGEHAEAYERHRSALRRLPPHAPARAGAGACRRTHG